MEFTPTLLKKNLEFCAWSVYLAQLDCILFQLVMEHSLRLIHFFLNIGLVQIVSVLNGDEKFTPMLLKKFQEFVLILFVLLN